MPEIVTPLPVGRVAALSASRASAGDGGPNLIPPEYAERYHAAFVDRVWMSGIIAVFFTYILLAAGYFGVLKVLTMKVERADGRVKAITGSYNETRQLKAQLEVLSEQQNYKFAALDCWEAVARNLPEDLTLNSLALARERSLTLFGTAPQDQSAKVTEFNSVMKKYELEGASLFAEVKAPNMQGRQGGQISWNFSCEMKRQGQE